MKLSIPFTLTSKNTATIIGFDQANSVVTLSNVKTGINFNATVDSFDGFAVGDAVEISTDGSVVKTVDKTAPVQTGKSGCMSDIRSRQL